LAEFSTPKEFQEGKPKKKNKKKRQIQKKKETKKGGKKSVKKIAFGNTQRHRNVCSE